MVHRSSCEFRDHQESSSLVSEKRKHLAAWCSNAGIIYGNLDDGLHGDSKEFEDSSLKKDFEPGADSVLRFRAPKQGWVSGRGSLQPQEDTSRPGFVYRKAPFDESHAAKSKAETLRFLEVSAIAGDLTLASKVSEISASWKHLACWGPVGVGCSILGKVPLSTSTESRVSGHLLPEHKLANGLLHERTLVKQTGRSYCQTLRKLLLSWLVQVR